MKLLIPLLCLGLLCGCSNKEDRARIEKMENRISLLETNLNAMADLFQNGISNISKMQARSITNWMDLEARTIQNQLTILQMQDTLNDFSNPPPARSLATRYGSPPARPATKAGVPTAVYDSIAASAAERWGGKYDMQVYEIRKQVEAYKALHGL